MASSSNPGFKERPTNPPVIYATVNKKSVSKKKSAQKEFQLQDPSLPVVRPGGPLMEDTPLPFGTSPAPVDDIFHNLDDYPLEEQIDIIYSSSRKFTPNKFAGRAKRDPNALESVPSDSVFDRAFRKWEDKMQKGGWIDETSSIRSWSDFQLVLGEVNPPSSEVIPSRNMREILKSPSHLSTDLSREIALELDRWYLDTVCSQWEVEQLMHETDVGTFCITNPDVNGFINLYVRVDPLIHNASIQLHKIGILYRRYKIRESTEYFFSLSSLLTHFCAQSSTLSSDLYLISPRLNSPAALSPGDRVKLEDYPVSLSEKERIYNRAREIAAGHRRWLLAVSSTEEVHAQLNKEHAINFLIWECRDTAIKFLSIYFEQDVTFDCKLRGSRFGFEVQECPIIFPSLTTLLSYMTLFTSSGYLPCHIRYPKPTEASRPPNQHSQNLFNRLKLENYLTSNKDFWYYEVSDESAITSLLCYRHVGSFVLTVSDGTNYTLSIKNSLHSILHFPVLKNNSELSLKLGTFRDTHYSLPALLANSLLLVRIQQRGECAVVVHDVAYPFAFAFDAKRHKLQSQISYKEESLRSHLKETRSIWYQNSNPPEDIKALFSSSLALRGSFFIFSSDSIPFLTIYFLLERDPEQLIGECLIESTAEGTLLSGADPSFQDLMELVVYCCLKQHNALPLLLVPPFTTK